MASRRMFTDKIIDSDAFLDMPMSTQCLYFHLGMRADDDGFINNPKKIMRMLGASDDDMRILFTKNFIIGFEIGVIVIKHWRMHNYIRNDRYKPTQYQVEKKKLELKTNGSYTLKNSKNEFGIPNVNQMDTQVRLGKVSKGKEKYIVAFDDATIEFQLSKLLYQSILKNDTKHREPDLQKWALHIDRLIRLDKRDPNEIKSVIQYATSNDFWKSNILSTKKLREKFSTLLIQMNRGDKNGSNQQTNPKDKKTDWDIGGIVL